MKTRTKTSFGWYGFNMGIIICVFSSFLAGIFGLTNSEFPNQATENAFVFTLWLAIISIPFTLFSFLVLSKYKETDEEYELRMKGLQSHESESRK